jgi:hypothetical protein
MCDEFEYAIPTRDAIAYVPIIAREYVRLNVRPRYFVDGRSDRLYKLFATRLLPRSTLISTEGECIEEIIPELAAYSTKRWMIRVDDDELPSANLIQWLSNIIGRTSKTVIAFPRRAVRFGKDCAVYARTIPCVTPGDYQYRAFVRGAVQFNRRLHTPGFDFDKSDALYAPEDCCLYHFDWIVRDRLAREAKLRKYEHIQNGTWSIFKHQYLPEDFASEEYNYVHVDDPSIARLANRLRVSHSVCRCATRVLPGWRALTRIG